MVPIPVSHPSDVEMRELRAISGDLVCRAACVGYASCSFHGYRLAAVRRRGVQADHVDVVVKSGAASAQLFEYVRAHEPPGAWHRPSVRSGRA